MFKRLIASLVCITFSFSNLQYTHAQTFSVNQLPVPGTMVGESVPFAPLALKGLIVNPQKPLEFQFIVDTGRGPQDTATIKDQANLLVKYFLAGLTIPEKDLWVNLSPYEKNKMVPAALGQTDLGRDLLAQDYILKQLTASLIYPEKDLGKEFWSRVYSKAQAQFGTTNVPVNTFNKVWILPDQAQVYENVNAAYVTKSTLKVMLDEDYLALKKHTAVSNGTDSIGSQIVRQIILPEITKEVNTGKNFAPLRQIYQALILAKWYKETIRNGLLDAVYTNKKKIAGINLNDPQVKEQIYERYLKAYKKGAFNYIKEDPTPNGQVVPRKYFSGGLIWTMNVRRDGAMSAVTSDGAVLALKVDLEKQTMPQTQPPDAAMTSKNVTGRLTDRIRIMDSWPSKEQKEIDFREWGLPNKPLSMQLILSQRNGYVLKIEKPGRLPTSSHRVILGLGWNKEIAEAIFRSFVLKADDFLNSTEPLSSNQVMAQAIEFAWIADREKVSSFKNTVSIQPDDHVVDAVKSILESNNIKGYSLETSRSAGTRTITITQNAGSTLPANIVNEIRSKLADLILPGQRLTLHKSLEGDHIFHIIIRPDAAMTVNMDSIDKFLRSLMAIAGEELKAQGADFDQFRITAEDVKEVMGKVRREMPYLDVDLTALDIIPDPNNSTVALNAVYPIYEHQPIEAHSPALLLAAVRLTVLPQPDHDSYKIIMDLPMDAYFMARGEPFGEKWWTDPKQYLILHDLLVLTARFLKHVFNSNTPVRFHFWKDHKDWRKALNFKNQETTLEELAGQSVESEQRGDAAMIGMSAIELIEQFEKNGFKGNRNQKMYELLGQVFSWLKKFNTNFGESAVDVRNNGDVYLFGPRGDVIYFYSKYEEGHYFPTPKGLFNRIVPEFLSIDGKKIEVPVDFAMSTPTAQNKTDAAMRVSTIPTTSQVVIESVSQIPFSSDSQEDHHAIKKQIENFFNGTAGIVETVQGIRGLIYKLPTLKKRIKELRPYVRVPSNVIAEKEAIIYVISLWLKAKYNLNTPAFENIRGFIREGVGINGPLLKPPRNIAGLLLRKQTGRPLTLAVKKQLMGDIGRLFLLYGLSRMSTHIRESTKVGRFGVPKSEAEEIKRSFAESLRKPPVDSASLAKNGGIDLNQINVLRNGKTVNVQFDQAQLNQLEQGGFAGFTPVIINITHISSPFQLLGINPAKEEVLAKA